MASKMKDGRGEDFLTKKGYQIGEKLDSGGFGTVYKAKRKGETVAVKVVKIDEKKATLDEDLRRELAVLAKVRHPNIVLCHDIMRTKHKVYIFMEFASGGTVGKYVRKNGPFPEWGAKLVFGPTSDALMYMHELGIAHRDLKLDNILLDDYFNPKLTDFGLSRYCKPDEHGKNLLSDTFCGTESYMPPEILQKKAYDPMISDVWSHGICLYVMLNDTYPFDRRNPAKMIEKQLKREWKFTPNVDRFVSEPLKDLLSKMLEPDTKKRIPLKKCLEHPWMPKIKPRQI
ncbi:serine/threonine-protein kinase-like protein 2 [Dinothrombium tinctorium]|uniref:non-specific serine/threonine protein kinase n=1 Tax=Dinothrombium tinctorium TaxID=1965070 RepID=A0A3S3RVL3_9ACAR|nr:serine/threonine-protein kinase-like protein 2 [Dinothrombium tinctorium]RWS06702.1 serine/threonine-protein kinase-like protein 2 [Dinothrombium tinctorium]